MSIYKKFVSVIIILSVGFSLCDAVTVDEIRKMVNDKQFSTALPLLQKEMKSKPKDGQLNYMAALCNIGLGKPVEAVSYLEIAEMKFVPEASKILAEVAYESYDFEGVGVHIEAYQKSLFKSKKTLPDDMIKLKERAQKALNMLDRIEKIVVIDSIAVDKKQFFKFYKMAKDCGSLSSASVLPDEFKSTAIEPVYVSENGETLTWAMNSDSGAKLCTASKLSDGSWEEPVAIEIAGVKNGVYPYFLSDGVTLYFAADDENSIGGYDIFVTRKDDDEFLAPQNVGMPYNSIYDDYLLVIDETNGVGWWATDRNRLKDRITIYKYLPSEVRNNYSADENNLIDKALLRNYKFTWENGADYSAILNRIDNIGTEEEKGAETDFKFAMPDGRVLTLISDFHSMEAREKVYQYFQAVKEIDENEKTLSKIRIDYANGNKSISSDILKYEKNIRLKKLAVKEIVNDIITTELKTR